MSKLKLCNYHVSLTSDSRLGKKHSLSSPVVGRWLCQGVATRRRGLFCTRMQMHGKSLLATHHRRGWAVSAPSRGNPKGEARLHGCRGETMACQAPDNGLVKGYRPTLSCTSRTLLPGQILWSRRNIRVFNFFPVLFFCCWQIIVGHLRAEIQVLQRTQNFDIPINPCDWQIFGPAKK